MPRGMGSTKGKQKANTFSQLYHGTIIMKRPIQNTASSIFEVFDIIIPNIRACVVSGPS
jgi:hypothetical protein